MRRARRIISRSKKFVRLINDVNCIPAGVYRWRGREGGSMQFEVGPRIAFTIVGLKPDAYEALASGSAATVLTTTEAFLERYYQLLADPAVARRIPEPGDPMTMCFLEPSIAREIN